ncbi:unnamed protein product [Symbiodinium natans]|uniref:Protein phosphatase n=1 Tax=Symbiodinium natans TaxID=878477 RepID=A0A812SRY1_9DINO|nr:unnamed protein product [Symbiodinium natans]
MSRAPRDPLRLRSCLCCKAAPIQRAWHLVPLRGQTSGKLADSIHTSLSGRGSSSTSTQMLSAVRRNGAALSLKRHQEELWLSGTIASSMCCNALPRTCFQESFLHNARRQEAFAGTSSLGATTVLLAGIEDCQRLAVITLGDCALLVLRPTNGDDLRSTFRSQRVMMGEKTPAQVLRLPHQITGEQKELLEDFRLDMVQIKHGDVVVLGSDGLFDNLSDEAITHIVQNHCTQGDHDDEGPNSAAKSRSRPLVQQLPVLYKGRTVPSVTQLQQAAISLVDAAIQNVVLVADHPAAVPLVARGNPDDTTAIVAVVVEEGRPTDSDSEIELHDIYPHAEAMLNKVVCPDRPVCSAGIWPVCCYTAAIDRDDNEDSEVSSDHMDTDPPQAGSCSIS